MDLFKDLIRGVLKILAIRTRSRGEIENYLSHKTNNQDLIATVMTYVDDHQLVDDISFAKLYAQSRLKRGKGDIIIKQELKFKNISSENISGALETIEPKEWLDSMQYAIEKNGCKIAKLNKSLVIMKKRQILYQRGFSKRYIDAFPFNGLE